MTCPKIGALFAGYGGLDLAVTDVYGGHMAWYSEVDKGALKILGHRFPDVPNVGDVTTADWSTVEPVDILTGGSPCQDLSHAGRRAGMTEGTRSNLWVAMREAIAQLRPGLVVWENVRGALSAPADSDLEPCAGCVGDRPGVSLRALGRVVGDLSELGYVGQWHGLRAADVGAPHGRWRVFLTATDAASGGGQDEPWRDDSGRPLVGTGTGAGGGVDAGDSAAGVRVVGRGAGQLLPTPTSSDTNGPGAHGDGGVDLRTAVAGLLPTPTARDWKNAGDPGKTAARMADRGQPLTEITVNLLPTPRTQNNENRQSEGYGGEDGNFYGLVNNPDRWGDYAAAIARWERTLGRPAPAPTMTSTKGNPQLSPVFVEWLMGLPAGWVTDVPGITRNEALKALGNGVVPQQAAAALRVMAASEGRQAGENVAAGVETGRWTPGPDPFLGDDPHRPNDPPAVTALVDAGLRRE